MIQSFFKTPKGYLLIGLFVLIGIADFGSVSVKVSLLHIGLAVGTSVLVDLAAAALLR